MRQPKSRFTTPMLAGVSVDRDVVSFSLEISESQQLVLIKSRLRNRDHDVTILPSLLAQHIRDSMARIDNRSGYTKKLQAITQRIPIEVRRAFEPRPTFNRADRDAAPDQRNVIASALEVHGYSDCVYLVQLIEPATSIYKVLRLYIPIALLLAREISHHIETGALHFLDDKPTGSVTH